jgi:hypothetical protein
MTSSYQTPQALVNQMVAQSRENKKTSNVCGTLGAFLIYAGICSFYMTETILLFEDVHFPSKMRKSTRFFLDSTAATAICGTLTWGLMAISVFTEPVSYVRISLRLGSFLGIGGSSILWIINIVVTGLWDFGHLSEVSLYAPSYFFTLYIFNIVIGFVGFYVFLVSVVMAGLEM